MNDDVKALSQQPEADRLVTLFQLDARVLGDSAIRYFARDTNSGAAIVFDGNTYTPVDFEAEGFEWNGRGALPQPKIRFSNVNRVFSGLVADFGDLVGATVTRIRTFARFLDGAPGADPTATFANEVYLVDRKSDQNKIFVEFELAAAMDQAGRHLPGRLVLRDYCTLRYRRWDASAGQFDYTKATCPYVGKGSTPATDGPFYDTNGNQVTAAADDQCGKRLIDCRLRFDPDPLPGNFFPGVGRV